MVRTSVVVRVVLGTVLWLVIGCGDNLPPTATEADILSQLSVRVIGTLHPDAERGLAVSAVDGNTIAIVRASSAGATFCPECVGVDPAECPAVCRRTRISVEVLHATGGPEDPVTVAQVFPRSPDHDVGGVDIVALGNRRVGIGWIDCDYAPCGSSGHARESCDARYTTLELPTLRVGPIATLYEARFGELQLTADPRTQRLLAITSKQRATGVGLRAAIYDGTGTMVAMPWTPLGGTGASAASSVATADGFTIVADDRNPADATTDAACEASCDCVSGAPIDLAAGGLYAFHLDGGPPWTDQIAPGKGHDGVYGAREATTTILAGDRIVVAAGQSIDRAAELFDAADGRWSRRLVSKAPTPLWIGALGDAQRLAWLGSEPAPPRASAAPESAVQSLVAGVIDGSTPARGELEPAVDSRVFDVAPLTADDGVTRTFLLRGVFDGGALTRYELLEVRAQW